MKKDRRWIVVRVVPEEGAYTGRYTVTETVYHYKPEVSGLKLGDTVIEVEVVRTFDVRDTSKSLVEHRW